MGREGEAPLGGCRTDVSPLLHTTPRLLTCRKRLDPSLARDEQWIQTLLAVSGWPACAVDFLRKCRAPVPQVRGGCCCDAEVLHGWHDCHETDGS